MVMNSNKPNLATLDPGEMSDAGELIRGGAALQQTRTEYTASIVVQRPRDMTKVLENCLKEARLCGPDFYYQWSVNDKNSPTGKSIIEGVSIDAAMIVARNFGNCAIPVELAASTPSHWILRATFVDFETGFNMPRLFQQRKSQNMGGKMDPDRAQDIAFQIGQSKAQRNAIVKAMPGYLLNQCFDVAKQVEEDRFKDVKASTEKMLAHWGKTHGITQEQLERKVGRKTTAWIPRDLAVLWAIFRGIKEGSTSLANEFEDELATVPEKSSEAKPAAATDPTKSVRDAEFEDVTTGTGSRKDRVADAIIADAEEAKPVEPAKAESASPEAKSTKGKA